MGKIFEKNQRLLNWEEIVAIADKNKSGEIEFCKVPIIHPSQIKLYNFDYIVVFSDKLYEEIKKELKSIYFIPEKKIVSWRMVISHDAYMDERILSFYINILKEFPIDQVLDIGMKYFPKYFFDIARINHSNDFSLDGIGNYQYVIGKSLYRNIYKNIDLCNKKYDVALLWDDIENIKQSFSRLAHRTKFILFHIPYCLEKKEIIEKADRELHKYFKTIKFKMEDAVFWLVDLSPKTILKEINIYVVMHKEYQVRCDELYQPICVGKFYQNKDYLTETAGENISYLNDKINECTALYWIWKNTNSEYVGLNHYRRYFYNNGVQSDSNFLDKENIEKLLDKYDLILATAVIKYEKTVLEGILEIVDYDLCMKGLTILKDSMRKYQSDYVEAFEHVMNGHSFHPCNMFVTRRKILNMYCEWLFSFLIEAAEKMDISGYDVYSKRIMGFLAERLLTTWLLKQNLKIKEQPYTVHFGLN